MEFHYNTSGKLVEILTPHCNLTIEQYEEISGQFLYLVQDIQDGEPQEEIENRLAYLKAVFEFLYNTKELTLKEQYELNQMMDDILDKAVQTMAALASREGEAL